MFAALAEGQSEIHNLSSGDDVATTLRVLQQLGVLTEERGDRLLITGRSLSAFADFRRQMYCGNSGTTLRLMLGILAGSKVSCELSGDNSLNRRPVRRVITPLRQMGADLQTTGDNDRPPVIVCGQPLHGITYDSPVASAQVKSAVMLAALFADGETIYSEPSQSRDHTERFLASQGINIQAMANALTIQPPVYLQPFVYDVPGDVSTATYFIVAATLAPDSQLVIENVLLNETRTGAIDILKTMGANIVVENVRTYSNELVGDIVVKSSELHGIDATDLDSVRFIDEVPILSIAAAFAEGPTTFANMAELRVKESDRLQGTADMLTCYGCDTLIEADTLTIVAGARTRLCPPDHRGDHRLAMAIEIMELLLFGSLRGDYQECFAISAPEFYHTLQAIVA
jgi:3-phosphoshikimate 1-carboxyvinyltransferase